MTGRSELDEQSGLLRFDSIVDWVPGDVCMRILGPILIRMTALVAAPSCDILTAMSS